jgi:hypothetical protein
MSVEKSRFTDTLWRRLVTVVFECPHADASCGTTSLAGRPYLLVLIHSVDKLAFDWLVELPFAALKYRIFGHPRFLLRGLTGAQTEISLATLVYNLKRMLNILGGIQLRSRETAGVEHTQQQNGS